MSEPSNNVRELNSIRPYQLMAQPYLDNGWFPIPLKPKDKPPYESGYTGRKNPFPNENRQTEMVEDWLGRVDQQANIGVWLRDGIIGIDVDDYIDKGKVDEKTGKPKIKTGMKTLRALEQKLGKLPPTWISTARSDGKSGIRMYQIPKGLAWPGKAGNDIDVIQHGHRFAVVYPSHHPEVGGTYQWYGPGAALDGNPDRSWKTATKRVRLSTGEVVRKTAFEPITDIESIPAADSLPMLPDKWIDYLTDGRIKHSSKPIDMDTPGGEIIAWAQEHFRDGDPCSQVRKRLNGAIEKMEEDSSSHDKILNAHFSILMCGVEGHAGAIQAAAVFEEAWTKNVSQREKRDPETLRMELYRSKMGALRIAKGRYDEGIEQGVDIIRSRCACYEEVELPDDTAQVGPRPTGEATDPGEYRMNDDGNAQHLCDLYTGSLIYVPGYGQWMFWTGERWLKDEDGLARRCFYRVRDRQEAYATQLLSATDGIEDEDDLKAAKAKAKDWLQFSRRSGNNMGANGALEAAQSLEGISVSAELMDKNERLLGVNNGVIELNADGPATFRKALHDDYVTVNTDVDFYEGGHFDMIRAGGDLAKGVQLWADYLNKFIPDEALRRFTQKALGYCLLGNNEQRLAIFLHGKTSTGKSTMLNAVMAALGGYAETVDLSIFKEKASGLNPALAQAMPRRIITASEAGMQNHMHADLFKRMTGNDRISAELKGVNVIVTRIPAFTPIIATNLPPTIKGADSALQRRLLVIPFEIQIPEDEDEKSATVDLGKYASPAILSWLVDGWSMYAQEGLPRSEWPVAVKESTKEFGGQLNDLGEFLTDATEEVPFVVGKVAENSGFVPVQDMYDAYSQWTIHQKISERDILSKNIFGRQLKTMGIEQKVVKIDGNPTRCWIGRKIVGSEIKIKVLKK